MGDYFSTTSWPIMSDGNLKQNLFVIENNIASRVDINIRRLVVQNDATVVMTVVMPQIKAFRINGNISGGILLPKCPFDTDNVSDSGVLIRVPVASGNPITATETQPFWQQYTERLHTAAEQQTAWDNSVLPILVAGSGNEFKLKRGESLLVQLQVALATSNPTPPNNWFIQAVWEEETASTFAISGVVTLDGSPVDGAKVVIIEAKDQSMTSPVLVEVKTTNALGQWNSTIRTGCVGAAFVQYKSGSTYYTAPGSPFLGV